MPKGSSCFKISAAKSTEIYLTEYAHHLLFTFYPFYDEAYLKYRRMTAKKQV